jgi:hypothetical protein
VVEATVVVVSVEVEAEGQENVVEFAAVAAARTYEM